MHTITGGTGHFAGAAGAFTIHRVVDQSTGGTSGAFDGTIVMTQYDERGWRVTFYTTGMEHSPTSATDTSWERTPWHATQRVAWEALKKGESRV